MKLPSFDFGKNKKDNKDKAENKQTAAKKTEPVKKKNNAGKVKSFSKKRDSLIGIPLLFTLAGFSAVRNSHKPDNVKKIAVLKISNTRDTFFTYTAIKALKEVYPEATITFFTGENNFNSASLIPYVSNTVKLFSSDTAKSMKVVKLSGKYDLWIDFGVWSRLEAIMTHTAAALYKIGFRTNGEHRHFAYDKVIDYDYNIHEADNFNNLMSALNIYIKKREFNDYKRDNVDKNLVIIDIFSDNESEKNRQWSHQNWKSVVEHINKKGMRVTLVGGRKDIEESEKFNEMAGSGVDIDFLVGRLDFLEKTELLKKASLVIAGDNSTLHTASFLNVPVIGLYGPTSSKLYGPTGNNVHVIESNSCSGCQNTYGDEECYMAESECMSFIKPETVCKIIDEILGEKIVSQ